MLRRDLLIVTVLVKSCLILRILALRVKVACFVVLQLLIHVRVLELLSNACFNLIFELVATHHVGCDDVIPMLVNSFTILISAHRVNL